MKKGFESALSPVLYKIAPFVHCVKGRSSIERIEEKTRSALKAEQNNKSLDSIKLWQYGVFILGLCLMLWHANCKQLKK